MQILGSVPPTTRTITHHLLLGVLPKPQILPRPTFPRSSGRPILPRSTFPRLSGRFRERRRAL